jgi:hypothetical protein
MAEAHKGAGPLKPKEHLQGADHKQNGPLFFIELHMSYFMIVQINNFY